MGYVGAGCPGYQNGRCHWRGTVTSSNVQIVQYSANKWSNTVVFMGSEKYPAENDFDAFLKKHGGSDNASTDCERTIFQFDVHKKYFREALDRWAQFFICPLMIEDAVDREVEAVDSEYQLARPSDSHRKEMLFGSLAKPGHPMGKFCWGEKTS
ncbi:hypothetical protein AMECASPLE_035528 [Ameca splendens]|uniref:Peptidase M16 N-terminal domain-containing protein n=1 Tax=Ameca splendens TaxID=208324 RepID=A0ABV0XWA1_9TELE